MAAVGVPLGQCVGLERRRERRVELVCRDSEAEDGNRVIRAEKALDVSCGEVWYDPS